MICFEGELWKDNHLVASKETTITTQDTRTHQIFKGLEDLCYQLDLGNPIWLDSNVSEFKRHNRTRFTKDSFVEAISFDYLLFRITEEDFC